MIGNRLKQTSIFLLTMAISSPAYAGTSGRSAGAFSGFLRDLSEILRGDIVIYGGTIAVIVILAGAWFSGGPDRLKNALIACAIAVGIVQAPTIVSSLINSAGALI